MTTLLLFIIVLGILVFVHELGHFVMAKKMGMHVEEFGFGFPPRIAGWKSKKDGVLYSINWIPLGGFVRIKGEDGEHADEEDSFAAKKPWQRFVVLVAGVAMNFLLCAALFSVGYMIGLPQSVTQEDVSAGRVQDHKIQVVNVLDGAPAFDAGLEIGDVIKSANGTAISSVEQLVAFSSDHVNTTAAFTIQRGEEILTRDIPIKVLESTGKGGIGIGLIETGVISYPWYTSIYKGVETSVVLTKEVTIAFGGIIKNLATGQGVGGDVSGPVGIAVLTGEVAQLGWVYLLQFTAMLSLNLAIINILPFPALDGGRIVFVLFEKIVGRPVKRTVEAVIHTVGFSLLMLLILIVTFKDLMQYSDIFSNIVNKIF